MKLRLSSFFLFLFLVKLTSVACAKSESSTQALQVRVMSSDEDPHENSLLTPLGSLWKLYVYAYQVENQVPEKVYTCSGKNPDELFCCKPKESIGRELALAQSCSPYFSESVRSITAKKWSEFWSKKIQRVPTWLAELEKLKPEIRVPVDDVLYSLLAIRKNFLQSERILSATLGSVLYGTAIGAVNTWGSTLKVKTYTWRDNETSEKKDGSTDAMGFTGGFAGWLPDGAAIWVSGAGHGRETFLPELKNIVEAHSQKFDSGCVSVNYFSRYPIKSVEPEIERLSGPVTVKFKNGNKVKFDGDGSLLVHYNGKKISIRAQMSINEYVARVIDREIRTTPIEAARAFSLAIRTFLMQNSKDVGGCRSISDSSHTQRVSPSAASSAALKIARWSDGLLLGDVSRLRYHSLKEGVNQMSWVKAKSLAESGYVMTEILKSAYPTAEIAYGSLNQPLTCTTNVSTEKWIKQQSKHWWRELDDQAGFERPAKLKICKLDFLQKGISSRVFSNLQTQEIFVPEVLSAEDEVSVLHEYLHIGFRFHPRGRDELFVENMARKILEEN